MTSAAELSRARSLFADGGRVRARAKRDLVTARRDLLRGGRDYHAVRVAELAHRRANARYVELGQDLKVIHRLATMSPVELAAIDAGNAAELAAYRAARGGG